ncbi:MAG: isochorismatase family protein [Candidatus Paceibacterota bacterium]
MYGSALSQEGVAVILIDMQNGFMQELREGALKKILPNQLAALEAANALGISVAVLEFRGYGDTLTELMNQVVKSADYEVFIKCTDSGFSCTAFEAWLEARKNIQTLFLMGINAGFCVRATATDAIRKGYTIMTSTGVIAGQKHHKSDDYIGWYHNNGTLIEA